MFHCCPTEVFGLPSTDLILISGEILADFPKKEMFGKLASSLI